MLAAHVDSLLFLLFVGIALLTRFLASKAGGASQGPEDSAPTSSAPPPIPRARPQSNEEQVRKFLEALGQPPTAMPPPKVTPRESAPSLTEFQRRQIEVAARERRRRNILNPIPSLTTVPPPPPPRRVTLPQQMTELPNELKTPHNARSSAAGQSTEPPAVQTAAQAYALSTQPATSVVGAKTDLAALLASPDGLRNAIILREILGPPRSLQPLDLVGSA